MEICEQSLAVPKPRRRWLKRISCGLLVAVILILCAWAWRNHTARQHLDEVLAELDRTDPGWRMEDIEAAREQIPEDENSAGVIIAAAQNLPRSWPPEDLPEEYFWSWPPSEMLRGEDFVRLSVEMASVKSAVDIAAKLADMPRGRYRFRRSASTVFEALPTDQLKSRTIVTLLVYESLLWSQRGESRSAFLACRAAINAARSLGDEPSPLSQHIRRAGIADVCWAIERALGQGEPPPEDMADVQKRIENEDAFPALFIATRGRRASGHRVFAGLERGALTLDDLSSRRMGWLERTLSPLRYMDTREDHALFLSLMTRRIPDVQRALHEQAALDQEFVQAIRALPKAAFITQWLLPASSDIGEKFCRKHANLRCAIAALAAERFRQEKKVWADKMDQLCPQYLAPPLLDPFDGKPLRYRRVEDGVIIYSVGQDGVDNGGRLDRQQQNHSETDIGFRLWDVPKRRQQPHPKPPEDEKPR